MNVTRWILDRLTETMYNEHAQDTRLFKPGKSTVAEHWIHFSDTKLVSRITGCLDHSVKEAREIWCIPTTLRYRIIPKPVTISHYQHASANWSSKKYWEEWPMNAGIFTEYTWFQ
jgi:hypothetical protein